MKRILELTFNILVALVAIAAMGSLIYGGVAYKQGYSAGYEDGAAQVVEE